MRKMLLLVCCLVLFSCCATLFGKNPVTALRKNPAVARITWTSEYADNGNRHSVHMILKDGKKVVLDNVYYDDTNVMRFSSIWRIDNIVPWEYVYHRSQHYIYASKLAFYNNELSILDELLDGNSVDSLFANIDKVYEVLLTLPLMDVTYREYEKNDSADAQTYFEMIEKRSGKVLGLQGYFRTEPSENSGVFYDKEGK